MFRKFCAIVPFSPMAFIRQLSTTIFDEFLRPGFTYSFTNNLLISEFTEQIPIYRVIDSNGVLLNPSELAKLDKNLVIRFYKCMRTLKEIDKILYECQRQGRISFYMTNYGEEGTQIGSAAALNPTDLIFPQYRESGILLWRGYKIYEFVNQCYGNKEDTGKGKQMPVHYGSRELHYVTVSSPLGTQLPQAVGAAYSYKLEKNGKCAVTYFGDGAASEGDAHAAFNFAATLECPVIFICRNNGYAISTPAWEQYKGDGIAGRAAGYSVPAIRVDGNDVFAVYNATKLARSFVVSNNKPIILEALTYRRGHHSTSDDSAAYRSKKAVDKWEREDPIVRLKYFMEKYDMWQEELEMSWLQNICKEIKVAVMSAEKIKKPQWQEMFNDVYKHLPKDLQQQRRHMENHVKKYETHYPLNDFDRF